jgi:hypothetical protein
MKIYADNSVCEYQLKELGFDQFTGLDDCDLAVFQTSFDDNAQLESKINSIDKPVIILSSELNTKIVSFIEQNQNPRIKYFICGSIAGIDTHPWLDWFQHTVNFYKNKSVKILDQLTPYQVKDKYFDILLGRPKPHRDYIYNYVNQNKLINKVMMTYLHSWLPVKQQGVWPVDIPDNIYNTITQVSYNGVNCTLSQIIHPDIYNETAYSVIAETNANNRFNFYTEKTVKPILAERLFIAFCGKHWLRNLRSFGFKTFDGIIDESYDNCENDNNRFYMAGREMKRLIEEVPQGKILKEIQPITEHNKKVMLETNWAEELSKVIQAL